MRLECRGGNREKLETCYVGSNSALIMNNNVEECSMPVDLRAGASKRDHTSGEREVRRRGVRRAFDKCGTKAISREEVGVVVEIDGTMSKDVRFGRLPLRHNLESVEPSCNLERTILGRQFAPN